jgi:hypothetical protein
MAHAPTTASNTTADARRVPRTTSTVAANNHPAQAMTAAIGQPRNPVKAPLNSNTTPAMTDASTDRCSTRARK